MNPSKKSKQASAASDSLTRRERQIMDVVFAKGEITAREIWERIEDPPSYSTVRTLLKVLENKGHLSHRKKGKTYIYFAKKKRKVAAASALKRLVHTFFEGSIEQAVSGLLELKDSKLSDDEIERLTQLIESAKKEGEDS